MVRGNAAAFPSQIQWLSFADLRYSGEAGEVITSWQGAHRGLKQAHVIDTEPLLLLAIQICFSLLVGEYPVGNIHI